MLIKCENCNHEIEVNPAALLGSITSEKKATAARENGKKGGRPKQSSPQTGGEKGEGK